MRASIKKYRDMFDSRPMRERIIISAMTVSLLYLIWDFTLLESIREKNDVLQDRYENINNKLEGLKSEEKILSSALRINPNLKTQREIIQLEGRLKQLDKDLSSLFFGVISAEKFPLIMQEIIRKRPRLTLIAARTLEQEPIYFEKNGQVKNGSDEGEPVRPSADVISQLGLIKEELQVQQSGYGKQETRKADMYKHAVVLKFRGRYFDVMEYLRGLEESKWQIYWESLHYEVDQYPEAIVHLTTFTLSTQKGRIGEG